MRTQMFEAVSDVVSRDPSTVLLLADIGAMGFRKLLDSCPERAVNIGIFEDGMVGVAAGMALRGLNPIVYGITPFILGRAFEQLKLDFAYQRLNGNFLTTGAAYDFSRLGYSHYCPEDLGLMQSIPGMEFVAPGTGEELASLFTECYRDGSPTCYRLSDDPNHETIPVEFGKAVVIQTGRRAVVIAVSTVLDIVREACADMDVTILYYTTLLPFDGNTLADYRCTGKILLVEPHYAGTMLPLIRESLGAVPLKIGCVGVPRVISRTYGTKREKDREAGLTVQSIKAALEQLLKEE